MIENAPYEIGLFGEPLIPDSRGELSRRFAIPPFSVLSARDGFWQDRKRAWISLGIQSELGRGLTSGKKLAMSDTIQREKPSADQALKRSRANARWAGQGLMKGENKNLGCRPHSGGALDERPGRDSGADCEGGDAWVASSSGAGTSIFDPVLCELMYSWFCPPGGQIVDPFAGGSVRGIVAGHLGFKYWGCDLRSEQVEANEQQRLAIANGTPIEWVCGDAIDALENAPDADFVFSCPPYGDLERYSDDPRDLSTMEYHTFIATYKRIILRSVGRLKRDRFACVVVGDFRDPKAGHYRGFVADTIRAFGECGMRLYNDAIIVTAVGSLPIRVSGQFDSGRKLGKTHQNVLVFVKGDWRKAAAACVEDRRIG